MSNTVSGSSLALGFHTFDSIQGKNIGITSPSDKQIIAMDLTMIASWIPGLCIISAIYHLVLANEYADLAKSSEKHGHKSQAEDERSFAKALRIRAASEFLQASVILMIFDLGATMARFCPCCQKD